MTDRKRFYVLDGTALLYRAYFAMIHNPLMTSSGQVTSGIYGFMNGLVKLLREETPDYLAVTFDDRAKTFRHEIYTDYKATREKMPDELAEQIEPLDRVLEALKVPILRMPGYEADDVMGTLATQAEARGWHTYLVTGDKDMMQLVSDHTQVYVPARGRTPAKVFGRQQVLEKWGVPPDKMVDFLGLMGDSSDNVPGVPGVGEKTAVKLIVQYGSLEAALDAAAEIAHKRLRRELEKAQRLIRESGTLGQALSHATEVGLKRDQEALKTAQPLIQEYGTLDQVLSNASEIAQKRASELALLSKELVTIDCHVPLDIDIEQFSVDNLDHRAGMAELQELEIRALADDLLSLSGGVTRPAEEKPEKSYELVMTDEQLTVMLEQLTGAEWISFDLETTSLNSLQADIVGFSFSIRPHQGWYIPVLFPERGERPGLELPAILERLGPILEDPQRPIIGQNIKYDVQVMGRYGVAVNGIVFDTLIAAHLADPEAPSYKLDILSQKYLHYTMVPIEQLIGKKGKGQISMAEVPLDDIAYYATEDADVVGLLYPLLKQELAENGLSTTNDQIEVPLIPAVVKMEQNGVFLDLPFLEKMSQELEVSIRELEGRIIAAAGTEFNINSPQQLGVVLFDELGLKQIRKRSTDVTVLQMLKSHHPLPGLVLDYRQVKKLKSTYVDAFPALVQPQTGRVHSSFSQTVAATGRLSSSNPNFQNIPIRTELGREIRRAFRAQQPGWGIFSADYSQIELRVMAHLARESTLLKAFEQGQDIHSQTASMVFGVPLGEVTAAMRRTAKVVNFGIMYGAGPFRMSQELDISIQEGQDLINRYFNTYPGIRKFVDDLLAQARDDGYVSTILGRRRQVAHLRSSNHRLRSADERMAVNMPIQGTAAELIKIAMIRIHRRLQEESYRSLMILQIHDELLFETPEDEVDRLREMVVAEMEGAMKLDVPLKVDWGFGPSWYEAH